VRNVPPRRTVGRFWRRNTVSISPLAIRSSTGSRISTPAIVMSGAPTGSGKNAPMLAVRVLAIVAGVVLVLETLLSAVRTVVLPRAEYSWLTRTHFVLLRKGFDLFARPSRPYAARDRVLALYAPIGLVTLPFVWVALIIAGFTGLYWGSGVEPFSEAFVLSGSSVTTLGFARPDETWIHAFAFMQAGIGLGIVGLMISYLPSIYGAFERREAGVSSLEVRAGLPPSAAELFVRYTRIGRLANLEDDVFERFEQWFIDVEESHTSQPSLVFFRSPHPERSWITAAGVVLDSAALRIALIDAPRDARVDVTIRTGFVALRRIADYFDMPYDRDPAPGDPISVTRAEFDLLVAELRAAGVPLKPDLDRAWSDFAGWRVNYDAVLIGLAQLVMAPPARWISDRGAGPRFSPTLMPHMLARARQRRRTAALERRTR
jgi:hypothetical protein